MRRNTACFILVVAGVAMAVVLAGGVSAQSAAGQQDRDVLPALLTEVRGLRAAMERMASAGPRVQLAMGRLQLQEQRVNNLLRRVEPIRANLVNALREEGEWRRQIPEREEQIRSVTDANVAKQMEQEVQLMKQRYPSLLAEVQRLQVEESGIAQEIATEQLRWTEINQKMEELERSLFGQ